MYPFSTPSSQSITTCKQFKGESPAGRTIHCKVERLDSVRSFQFDLFNGHSNCFVHTKVRKKWSNYNSEFAKEFIFDIMSSILTNFEESTLQTGIWVHCSSQIAPRHFALCHHVRICLNLKPMDYHIKPRVTMVIH
jgi:hypothetical protein